MEGAFGILVLFVILAVVIRLFAGSNDRARIEQEVASRGGEVVSIEWAPLGKGWFGEKNDRIYSVTYRDREGRVHNAWCKTSMWSGVYFSDDRVIADHDESAGRDSASAAGIQQVVRDLEAENAELRRRLAEREKE